MRANHWAAAFGQNGPQMCSVFSPPPPPSLSLWPRALSLSLSLSLSVCVCVCVCVRGAWVVALVALGVSVSMCIYPDADWRPSFFPRCVATNQRPDGSGHTACARPSAWGPLTAVSWQEAYEEQLSKLRRDYSDLCGEVSGGEPARDIRAKIETLQRCHPEPPRQQWGHWIDVASGQGRRCSGVSLGKQFLAPQDRGSSTPKGRIRANILEGGPDPPPPFSSGPKKFFSSAFGATVLCVSWTIFDETNLSPKIVGFPLARQSPPPPPTSGLHLSVFKLGHPPPPEAPHPPPPCVPVYLLGDNTHGTACVSRHVHELRGLQPLPCVPPSPPWGGSTPLAMELPPDVRQGPPVGLGNEWRPTGRV